MGRTGRVTGYPSVGERHAKLARRDVLTTRLARAQARLMSGRPSVVVGGKRLLKTRANLTAAGLTPDQWRDRWEAARLFLTADGETGKRFGNETIRLSPEGVLSVRLPTSLAPGGVLTLGVPVRFIHRSQEWRDRVEAHQAVRYDIRYHPGRDRWYLDASWSIQPVQLSLEAATAARVLAVDLNDGHFAAAVLDPSGNRVAGLHTSRPPSLACPPRLGTGTCGPR